MKRVLLKGAAAMMLMSAALTSAADVITVTVYGYGGIIVDEKTGTQTVCPKASPIKCADIIVREGQAPGPDGCLWAEAYMADGSVYLIRVAVPQAESAFE